MTIVCRASSYVTSAGVTKSLALSTPTAASRSARVAFKANNTNTLRSFGNSVARKPRSTRCVTAAAAAVPAPAAAAATAAGTYGGRIATGTPLVELFETMTGIEAATRAGIFIVGAVAATILLQRFMALFVNIAETKLEQHEGTFDNTSMFAAIFAALKKPVGALLPYACFSFCLTVAASLAKVVGHRIQASTAGGGAWNTSLQALGHIAQALQDATEVATVAFITWFFLEWKNKMANLIIAWARKQGTGNGDNIARIVTPVSSLITWMVIVGAVIFSISIAGFDVTPLLTLGSVGTLAIALAAQGTVANVVSAMSLYINRPFIEGDRVHLKTLSGNSIVRGTVQTILPIKTIIVTDEQLPIYISNKDLATGMLVMNESQRSKQDTRGRPYELVNKYFTVRYADVDKLDAIQKQATAYISTLPTVLKGYCRVTGFNLYGGELRAKYFLTQEAYPNKSKILSDIVINVERIVRENGALLAMEEGVEYPEIAIGTAADKANGSSSYA